jgi:DUF4097 and DUF4098 domain-containing protein YvlB
VTTANVNSDDGSIEVRDATGDVTARTGSGPIGVSNVSGAVDAGTDDGSISLNGIAGSVTAHTGSGPIDGEDLRGTRTVARTDDGSITLRFTSAQDVEAHTGSGPIALTVPAAEGGYRIEARSDGGPTHIRVPSDTDGRRLINLSTDDGSITVDQG